jgi:hypothetical protein
MTDPALPERQPQELHTAHVLYPPQDPFASSELYPSGGPYPPDDLFDSGEPYPSDDSFPSGGPYPSDEPDVSGADAAVPAPVTPRNNMPLVAVIVAAALLLCGGTVVTGVLVARQFISRVNSAPPSASGGQPSARSDTSAPTATKSSDTPPSVVYEVTGNGPANITYLDESGIWTKTENNVRLPWRLETRPDRVTVLSLIAIRTGDGSSSSKVACRALLNGREIVKNSGSGRFGTASCYSYSIGG